MMTTDERKDHCRDRNLQNIGREYTLPADPPQQRMARWRQLPAANLSPVDRGSPSIRFVRRHGRFALATSGVAAAVLASIFWFSVGGSTPVSAATIFSALKAALQQGVTIRLEQIDLGNAVLDGEVIVQRAGEGQPLESQTFFSELGVTLMSDNPAWDDFQALSVVCRTPSDAWWFVRGAGGSARGINQIVQAEDLYHGLKWQRFGDDPLIAFGPIPLELSFWSWFSRVHYRFTEPQRRYVRGLLRFVHDLSAPESRRT